MLSVNDILSKAYFATLSTIEYLGNPVPVYKNQLPTDIAPGLYIMFGRIRSQDTSPKTSSTTQTTVTVWVYTNSLKYQDGVAVDVVGNEVLNRLYKVRDFNINLNSQFLIVNTTSLQQDFTQDYSVDKQNVYIDRVMIFSHTIFQNVS
jgi:hypothetical protein